MSLKFFCRHKKVIIKKYKGPIRLRIAQQFYECQDCGAKIKMPDYTASTTLRMIQKNA